MKRILAVLLSVSMLAALLPIVASAEEATVTKQDISGAEITSLGDQDFAGIFTEELEFRVRMGTTYLTEGVDYSVLYENDINLGTATVRVVGMGDYYGSVTKKFDITYGDTVLTLQGAYNGTIGGTLNDQIYYSEGWLSPGLFRAYTDCNSLHEAFYQLYRIEGDEPVLILEEEKEEGIHNDTMFTYDFTNVYNKQNDDWCESYMLAYAWVDRYNRAYSGAAVLYVPTKVPDATVLFIEQAQDGDFQADYLACYGEDGNVENVSWTSSDPAVAEVEQGVVTWKQPGMVTVTAQFKNLTTTQTLTQSALDLTQGSITGFSAQDGTADVVYDGRLLTPGTDYTVSVTQKDTVTEVVVTGCGLFSGQLVRHYDASGEPVGHSHGFTDSCDTTCATCDFTRTDTHQLKDKWNKDQTHHWHACTACGEKLGYEEHTFSTEDPNVCEVCGNMYSTGDIDCDGEITDWDGVLLARYLAGWTIEIVDLSLLDIDGDGEISDWDSVLMDRYLAGWSVTIE